MKNIPIDALEIPWGTSFGEAEKVLMAQPGFKVFRNNWMYATCNCSSIWGLPANNFMLSAPFADAPVLHANYKLEVLPEKWFEKKWKPYLKQLIKTLGAPVREHDFRKEGDEQERFLAFMSVWKSGDIEIQLKVNRQLLHFETGLSIAEININWINERSAAQPLTKQYYARLAWIDRELQSATVLEIFKAGFMPSRFFNNRYDGSQSPEDENNEELRALHLMLYKPAVYQTPKEMSDRLDLREFALCRLPTPGYWLLANKWDCVLITEPFADMLFYDWLPAKGGGWYGLEVGGLSMSDDRTGSAVRALKQLIESETGIDINTKQDYDA